MTARGANGLRDLIGTWTTSAEFQPLFRDKMVFFFRNAFQQTGFTPTEDFKHQLLENGGVEWLYFADIIDSSDPNNPGASISTFFNPNEYPDIQQGRFMQFGHKVMHNYNRENTGEVADIRYPYGAPVGVPGSGGKPALPVPGFWRGAFGPNPFDETHSGEVVYRNPNKPGYELHSFACPTCNHIQTGST